MKRRARALPPVVTLTLAVAIAIVFAAEFEGDGDAICALHGLVPAHPTVASALTAMFIHDPSGLAHVGGNLVVLLLVGAPVERAFGSSRYAALYFVGGLAGAALHIFVDPTSPVPFVGASASLFALLAVAAVHLGPGMLGFSAVLVTINIWRAFGGSGDETVSFACHLGGFAAGAAVVVWGRVRRTDLRHTVAA